MALGCVCGVPNTGLPDCEVQEAPIVGFIFQKMIADDNTANGITIATELTDTVRDAFMNNADPSKRMYPFTQSIDFVTPTATEPTFTTGQFGAQYAANPRSSQSVEFTLVGASQNYIARLQKALACGVWGVYEIDLNGNIYGNISSDGTKLLPKEIAKGSFIALYNKTNMADNLPNRGIIRFVYSQANREEDARILTEVTSNMLAAKGLVDINGTFSAITSTGFTLDVATDSVTAVKVPFEGLVEADFAVKDSSDDSVITITGFNETEPGKYVLTHSAQTGSFYVTITKAGFDSRLITSQINPYA